MNFSSHLESFDKVTDSQSGWDDIKVNLGHRKSTEMREPLVCMIKLKAERRTWTSNICPSEYKESNEK